MITQEIKTTEWELYKPFSDGFFIIGSSIEWCYDELNHWCKENPKKWVYVYPCGIVNGKHTLEIIISDKKIRCFMHPYSEGEN
jgi:hypothetical protein